jgi:hypothetical protein
MRARAIERKPSSSLSRVRRRFLNVTADVLGRQSRRVLPSWPMGTIN